MHIIERIREFGRQFARWRERNADYSGYGTMGDWHDTSQPSSPRRTGTAGADSKLRTNGDTR